MKKQLAVLLAAGLAVSAAGCSKTANTNETDVTAADTTEAGAKEEGTEESARETLTGHITLYTSQPEEDAEKLINGFNKEYPDITVDVFRSGRGGQQGAGGKTSRRSPGRCAFSR